MIKVTDRISQRPPHAGLNHACLCPKQPYRYRRVRWILGEPPFPLTAKLNKLTVKVDRPKLPPEDIKKLEAAMKAAADGPVSQDLSLVQRLEARFDKREECHKKAVAQKLGPIERIEFVRKCLE